MTDRVKGLTVLLDAVYREDDIEPLVTAIRQLRGVKEVVPVVWDHQGYLASWDARKAASDALRELAADLISEKFAPRFPDSRG